MMHNPHDSLHTKPCHQCGDYDKYDSMTNEELNKELVRVCEFEGEDSLDAEIIRVELMLRELMLVDKDMVIGLELDDVTEEVSIDAKPNEDVITEEEEV